MYSMLKSSRRRAVPTGDDEATDPHFIEFAELLRKYHEKSISDKPSDLLNQLISTFMKVAHGPSSIQVSQLLDSNSNWTSSFSRGLCSLFMVQVRPAADTTKPGLAAAHIVGTFAPPRIVSSPDVDETKKDGVALRQLAASPSVGWNALIASQLLADVSEKSMDVMALLQLPSTLVKCIHVLRSLPPSSLTVKDLDVLLAMEATVKKLLIRMMSRPSCVDELIVKNDMHWLFATVGDRKASWPTISAGDETSAKQSEAGGKALVFRERLQRCASDILMSVSGRSLSKHVINYITQKNCLKILTDALGSSKELPVENAEWKYHVLVCLVGILSSSMDTTLILHDQFRSNDGYKQIAQFILDLEGLQDNSEWILNKACGLVETFCLAGHRELMTPTSRRFSARSTGNTSDKLAPKGKGYTIRNSDAFGILQTLFLNCHTEAGNHCAIDGMMNLIKLDPFNYFKMQSLNTISKCIVALPEKSISVQRKLIYMLDYIYNTLHCVPLNEFVSMITVLKTDGVSAEFALLAFDFVRVLIEDDTNFKETVREYGLLDLLIRYLKRFLSHIVRTDGGEFVPSTSDDVEMKLGQAIINCIISSLKGSVNNAETFRDLGGLMNCNALILQPASRVPALAVIMTVVVCTAADEDMAALLGIVNVSAVHETALKITLLQGLCQILESHHELQMSFRRSGGFAQMISILISLEDSLSIPRKSTWKNAHVSSVLAVIRCVLMVIVAAIQGNIVNTMHLEEDVGWKRLCYVMGKLGCFVNEDPLVDHSVVDRIISNDIEISISRTFRLPRKSLTDVPVHTKIQCALIKLLLEASMNTKGFVQTFVLPNISSEGHELPTIDSGASDALILSSSGATSTFHKSRPYSCVVESHCGTGVRQSSQDILWYPGGFCILLRLVKITLDDQTHSIHDQLVQMISDNLSRIFAVKRNVQALCDVGAVNLLLSTYSEELGTTRSALELTLGPDEFDKAHRLRLCIFNMLEKLASYRMEPQDMKIFLRYGLDQAIAEARHNVIPMVCKPVFRELVSMITSTGADSSIQRAMSNNVPHILFGDLDHYLRHCDIDNHNNYNSRYQFYSYMIIPDITPWRSSSSKLPMASMSLEGQMAVASLAGIGVVSQATDKYFPPTNGFTFHCWLKIPSSSSGPFNVFTIISNFRYKPGFDNGEVKTKTNTLCSVSIDCDDKTIVYSVNDASIFTLRHKQRGSNDVVFNASDSFRVNDWNHLTIVVSRAFLKAYVATVYINGEPIGSKKVHYISHSMLIGVAGEESIALIIGNYQTTGTSPRSGLNESRGTTGSVKQQQQQRSSSTRSASTAVVSTASACWCLASCSLSEEPLTASQIAQINSFGAAFDGHFTQRHNGSMHHHLMNDKTSIHLSARHTVQLSIENLFRKLNKQEASIVMESLGLPTHDRVALVNLVPNTVGSLVGDTNRSFGAVLCTSYGYQIVRPSPVSSSIYKLGGARVFLVLILQCQDADSFGNTLKALVTALRSDEVLLDEMNRNNGYQGLAWVIYKKREFITSYILNLMMGFCDSLWTIDSSQNPAFEHLICHVELWKYSSVDVHRSLLDYINCKVIGSLGPSVLKLLHHVDLLGHFLRHATGMLSTPDMRGLFSTFIFSFLTLSSDPLEYFKVIFFLVSTISLQHSDEVHIKSMTSLEGERVPKDVVTTRNFLLDIILQHVRKSNDLRSRDFIEKLVAYTGLDFFMLFALPGAHESTVIRVVRLLDALFQRVLGKHWFRENAYAGKWMTNINILRKSLATQFIDLNRQLIHFNPKYTSNGYVDLLESVLLCHPSINLIPELAKCFGVTLLDSQLQVLGFTVPQEDMSRGDFILEFFPLMLSINSHTFASGYFLTESIRALDEFRSWFINCVQINEYNNFAITVPLLNALVDFEPSTKEETPNFSREKPPKPVIPEDSNEVYRASILKFIRDILVSNIRPSHKKNLAALLQSISDYLSAMDVNAQSVNRIHSDIIRSLLQYMCNDRSFASRAELDGCADNIFTFAGMVVEKLWSGQYVNSSQEVLEFALVLIAKISTFAVGELLNQAFRILSRVILFLLSNYDNPQQSDECMNVVDVLLKVLETPIIFSELNTDRQFVYCFAYCLFTICTFESVPIKIQLPGEPEDSHWHADLHRLALASEENDYTTQPKYRVSQKIWSAMCNKKKQEIEEVVKAVGLPFVSIDEIRDLRDARECLYGACEGHWNNFVTDESKLHSASHHKRTKRANTYMFPKILTGSKPTMTVNIRPSKIDEKLKDEKNNAMVIASMQHNVEICKSAWSGYAEKSREMRAVERTHQAIKWKAVEEELFRERGLWGPDDMSSACRWALDSTEGYSRMRRRLRRDHGFYERYFSVPKSVDDFVRCKKPSSWHCNEYKSVAGDFEVLHNDTKAAVDQEFNPYAIRDEFNRLSKSLMHERKCSLPVNLQFDVSENLLDTGHTNADVNLDDTLEISDSTVYEEAPLDQRLASLVHAGDKILESFQCSRISGLGAIPGLFLVGKTHYYVIDGYTYNKNGELVECDREDDDGKPHAPDEDESHNLCQKFAYEDIRDVLKRRYLLQHIAIEIFLSDGRSILLKFSKQERQYIYQKLVAMSDAKEVESLSGQRRSINIEQGTGFWGTMLREKSVTQRWEKGEITNFEYLVYLNTIAGRSYNDLIQYPVFPWIIADYESEVLDLTSANTYRDLTKPMGAQCPKRFEGFKKRIEDWDVGGEGFQPYFYNTHYSSAMIVAWFLVRLEPFSRYLISLQGGNFDLPDRMFSSIAECWQSASKNNMSDVKELIPEFFYLPEFLTNDNKFYFGKKQLGVEIDDVVLPPWSKGDAREFIRMNRMALESDYVSSRLNHWIDLIFGCKQKGNEAMEAGNSFHPLFYEGTVDFDQIADETTRQSTIGFINNFGQIPRQIFKRPHAQKKLSRNLMDFPSTPYFFNVVEFLSAQPGPIKDIQRLIGSIEITPKQLTVTPFGRTLIPMIQRMVCWNRPDEILRLLPVESDKGQNATEYVLPSHASCCCCCSNSKLLLVGCVDGTVVAMRVDKLKSLSYTKSLLGHSSRVTCITANDQYHLICSGSRDRTVLVWDMNALTLIRQLRPFQAPVSAICCHELTGDIVVAASSRIHYFTINGLLLTDTDTQTDDCTRPLTINALAVSRVCEWDDENVILVGSSDGFVTLWRLQFTQVPDETFDHETGTTSISDPSQEPSLEAAGTNQVDGSEVAGTNQVEPLQEPSLEAAGTNQVDGSEVAGTNQVDGSEAAGTNPVDGSEAVDTNQVNGSEAAGTNQVDGSEAAGTNQVDGSEAAGINKVDSSEAVDGSEAVETNHVDGSEAIDTNQVGDSEVADTNQVDGGSDKSGHAEDNKIVDNADDPYSAARPESPLRRDSTCRSCSIENEFEVIDKSEVEQATQWIKSEDDSNMSALSSLVQSWQLRRIRRQTAVLRPGNKWQRALVAAGSFNPEGLRSFSTRTPSSQTMFIDESHMVCFRNNYVGIVAIAVAGDHRSFYVGDSVGRVYHYTYKSYLSNYLRSKQ